MTDDKLKPVEVTQADIDAARSIEWVNTAIDNHEAIAEAFARHRMAATDTQAADIATHAELDKIIRAIEGRPTDTQVSKHSELADCPKCEKFGDDCGEHAPSWQELAEYWKAEAERRQAPDAQVSNLVSALEGSVLAIDDWLHAYASYMCNETYVDDSRQRILRNGGTLHYIACVQQANRAALDGMWSK